MKLLTRTTERLKFSWVKHSDENPPGSGYCDDWGAYIADVTTWRFLGLPVWSRRTKVRDLMQHEVIASATIGSYR
jgi:hypothetical protein